MFVIKPERTVRTALTLKDEKKTRKALAHVVGPSTFLSGIVSARLLAKSAD